jgi:hypothetical protein
MVSTDPPVAPEPPSIDWADTYRRTQQKLASNKKSAQCKKGRQLFWLAIRNLITWENPEEQAALCNELSALWDECCADKNPQPEKTFRREVQQPLYDRLFMHAGAAEKINDLFLRPVETGVWKAFLELAREHGQVALVFSVRRWPKMPWIFSNDHVLNLKLKRPLRACMEVVSRSNAPNVLIMPLPALKETP